MLERYGQPSVVLGDGIDTVKSSPTPIQPVWLLPNTANGTFAPQPPVAATAPTLTPPLTFAAYGQVGRAVSKLPEGSKVLAHFADGTPAAVVTAASGHSKGGGVTRLLWMPGMSWDHSGWLVRHATLL
jgi:hypothetical protein